MYFFILRPTYITCYERSASPDKPARYRSCRVSIHLSDFVEKKSCFQRRKRTENLVLDIHYRPKCCIWHRTRYAWYVTIMPRTRNSIFRVK